LHEGGFMHVHKKNTHASPTAACDGTHVYWPAMVRGAIWVSAVTTAGKIAWQTEAGPFVSMHGYGASPVLFENLVIVAGDSNGPGWLAALDRTTGKIAWRVQRGNSASFGTPVIAELAGKPQLLLSGHRQVVSYNPRTGDKLWQADGPADVCANTIVTKGDLLFASGGYPQAAVMAIRGDGSGQLVWKKDFKCYVPSMLVDGLSTETGAELWSKRLGGDITASPVLADEKIFVTNEAGATFVLQSGATFKQLATNDAGLPCFSTPAICGGRIYLRTDRLLLCIGSESREVAAD
jgi:outer membrane protein assembly factor BamB